MKNDEEIIKSLIAGGFIGAALGALISNDKEEGVTLGAIAGAALLATFRANEDAKRTNVPMYIEEDGQLFQVQPNGNKKFIRKIEKPSVRLQENFKLK